MKEPRDSDHRDVGWLPGMAGDPSIPLQYRYTAYTTLLRRFSFAGSALAVVALFFLADRFGSGALLTGILGGIGALFCGVRVGHANARILRLQEHLWRERPDVVMEAILRNPVWSMQAIGRWGGSAATAVTETETLGDSPVPHLLALARHCDGVACKARALADRELARIEFNRPS